jgi:hypothetical protein
LFVSKFGPNTRRRVSRRNRNDNDGNDLRFGGGTLRVGARADDGNPVESDGRTRSEPGQKKLISSSSSSSKIAYPLTSARAPPTVHRSSAFDEHPRGAARAHFRTCGAFTRVVGCPTGHEYRRGHAREQTYSVAGRNDRGGRGNNVVRVTVARSRIFSFVVGGG